MNAARSGSRIASSSLARGEHARDHAVADLVELAQLREPADARHLLGQHAVELRIDRVRADRQLDHRARGLRDRQRRDARELGEDRGVHLLDVALDQRGDQRLLVREVLVERADRHARGLRRDRVRGQAIEALLAPEPEQSPRESRRRWPCCAAWRGRFRGVVRTWRCIEAPSELAQRTRVDNVSDRSHSSRTWRPLTSARIPRDLGARRARPAAARQPARSSAATGSASRTIAARIGPIARLQLAHIPIYVVTDADLAHEVLVDRGRRRSRSRPASSS